MNGGTTTSTIATKHVMIDLMPFCATPNDMRGYLRQPFTLGQYTLASNGHILIRVDRTDAIPESDYFPKSIADKIIPMPDKMHQKLGTETGMMRLAEFEPDLLNCCLCEGTKLTHDCPACEGNGEIGDCYASKICETCKGSGAVSATQMQSLPDKFPPSAINDPYRCEACYGIGKRCMHQKDRIGAATFGSQYLLLAKSLADATVYAFGKTDPALIVFSGGLGILMPRRD
jgi:hypothetical protein